MGTFQHFEIGACQIEKSGKLRWEIRIKMEQYMFLMVYIIPDFGSTLDDGPHCIAV